VRIGLARRHGENSEAAASQSTTPSTAAALPCAAGWHHHARCRGRGRIAPHTGSVGRGTGRQPQAAADPPGRRGLTALVPRTRCDHASAGTTALTHAADPSRQARTRAEVQRERRAQTSGRAAAAAEEHDTTL
jgi:hypothetical protein